MNPISLIHAACSKDPRCSLQSFKCFWLEYNKIGVTCFYDSCLLLFPKTLTPWCLFWYCLSQGSDHMLFYLNCPSCDFLTLIQKVEGSLASSPILMCSLPYTDIPYRIQNCLISHRNAHLYTTYITTTPITSTTSCTTTSATTSITIITAFTSAVSIHTAFSDVLVPSVPLLKVL